MRTFTGEIAGLLSDQSAYEVAVRLVGQGIELDTDTVDARLSIWWSTATSPAAHARPRPAASRSWSSVITATGSTWAASSATVVHSGTILHTRAFDASGPPHAVAAQVDDLADRIVARCRVTVAAESRS